MREEVLRLLESGAQKQLSQTISSFFAKAPAKAQVIEQLLEWSHQLDPSKGVQLLKQGIHHAPRTLALYVPLVRGFVELMELDQAERWWTIANKIDPRHGPLWALGVELALKRQDLDRALVALERARMLLEEGGELLRTITAGISLWRGERHWERSEHDRALFWMRRAVVEADSWELPRQKLAAMLREMGREESALRYDVAPQVKAEDTFFPTQIFSIQR